MSIEQEVLELVSEAAGQQAKLDSDFDSLGLDSLDMTNLLLTIDNKYGVRIDFELFASMRTVGDLVKALPKTEHQ